MVKVKECCCGFTLRTGSLILMWLTLVVECMETLAYLTVLVNPRIIGMHSLPTAFQICFSIYLISSVVGIAVSVLGIHATQKGKKPQYLNGIFYYYCYQVIYQSLPVVTMIFSPPLYYEFFHFDPVSGGPLDENTIDYLAVKLIGYLFYMALLCYFALVLRSYRDSMKNNNNNAEIPDPAAIGYRYNVG